MSQLFYDAAPNATRVSPEREADRHYPEKPEAVTLFGTCVVDLFFPEAGLDAIRLLEREGVRVHFPQEQSCCGQPAWTSGYREEAKAGARPQLDILDRSGLPVVGPSGPGAGMFRHHYPALFADEPDTLKRVEALAERTFELNEFLLKVCRVQLADRGAPSKIALHTSCSARREMNTHQHARELLQQLEGVQRIDHDHESERWGFGGTFSVPMPSSSRKLVRDNLRSMGDTGPVDLATDDCVCRQHMH